MTASSSSVTYLLQSLIGSGPSVLVAVVGLLLTFVNWQKLGRVAWPAAGGFGLYAISTVGYLLVSALLRAQFLGPSAGGGSAGSIATYFTILGVANGILHAFALCCLLVAIMTPRTPAG